MTGRPRRIAHLDMDAFFASVELLSRPELRGRAVVVGGRRTGDPAPLKAYRGRGVITTCTYEARALGVRSGMGLMKAAALAPEALLLPADFEAYRRASRAFKEAALTVVPAFEDRGIDEIYLDLTDLPEDSRTLGLRLKAAVKAATGLTCSLGITPNKLLSKVASEFQKPDGLTILGAEDIPTRIWPLQVGVINGIGPKAVQRLETLGLITVGELAAAPRELLVDQFGPAYGSWLHEAAHGRDDRPLVFERDPKSISRETTFERDLHPRRDRERLTQVLLDLCDRLAGDLARKGVMARTVGIKVRYQDFHTVTRDLTLEAPVGSAGAIRDAARCGLRRVDLSGSLRLFGIRLGGLQPRDQVAETPSLFRDVDGGDDLP